MIRGMKSARVIAALAPFIATVFSVTAVAQVCGGLQELVTLGGASGSAVGVSADGTVVVGNATNAFRWTQAGGMQDLGPVVASHVSADGLVVVGGSTAATGHWHTIRWTEASGIQDLGTLGGSTSQALGVNADGSVIVGTSLNVSGQSRAFRWTVVAGMQDLGTLGGNTARASGVSADGIVVAGSSVNGSGQTRAFRWTPATGMQDLNIQSPWGSSLSSGATVVSGDGQVVAGTGYAGGSYAFRWIAPGAVDFVTDPVPAAETIVSAISFDGNALTGSVFDVNGHSFYWSATTGLRWMSAYDVATRAISADGGAVVGDWDWGSPSLIQPFRWSPASGVTFLPGLGGQEGQTRGISADGRVIVGNAVDVWGIRRPVVWFDISEVGQTYCTDAIQNSTGCKGHLLIVGSARVANNQVELTAANLPFSAAGFFLTSRNQGSIYPVNNSQGRLCLGGFIGRYVGPGQIKNSGPLGTFSLAIDLTSMPQPFGNVAAQPGETWHFQAWHRDANPTLTSNFTDAVSVTFQ
jgi:probable HAF family extracellular repeat protein